MTHLELRKKYFDFFIEKGHKIIPSAPLIPENDPSVLFTTAGMHPLVPFLLGEKHPAGQRLCSVQKCIRTGDINEVGDEVHLTFFEMLGNWSLGDYWKKEAIEWSFEFLTSKKWLRLDKERLAISVFGGDKDAARDEESAKIWQSVGIPPERIYFFGKKDNWWGPAGQTGPCGPCTEMFYWVGNDNLKPLTSSETKDWVEIWNDVFMEYNKTASGKHELLKQKNVDTGMGLERTLAVINQQAGVYETELFQPIIKKIEELSGRKYEDNKKEFRIIADHLKAATFILAEGLEPSNVERGYVLRRLIRRAVRYGKLVGIKDIFTFKISQPVIEIYKSIYPELKENKDFIEEQLIKEEEKFLKTLERGLKEFEKMRPKIGAGGLLTFGINGDDLFDLYSTYGFPIELSLEEIEKIYRDYEMEIPKDVKDIFLKQFYQSLKKHQELSRTASVGMFKGGLADHSEIATKYHTATHLLHQALRDVLGFDVYQKGSNITAERLRFDFSYSQKMTPEQIQKVEEIVNQKIKAALPVKMEEMNLEEAKKSGAVGVFAEKYGEKVKVYSIGDSSTGSGQVFSKEICAGPHVQNTSELGHFKIIKEEAVSSGVRRIKATLN